jgi:hypothetical protein
MQNFVQFRSISFALSMSDISFIPVPDFEQQFANLIFVFLNFDQNPKHFISNIAVP